MASAMTFPQQQQQSLAIQTTNSGASVDNNLLSALAQYVTTGAHARSTTEQEIQELAQDAISKPGGRAHLEALISYDCPEHQVWKNQASADGTITITKTNLTVSLGVSTLELNFEASGAGFFVPYSGSLNVGTLFYNEFAQLAPGNATFKLYVSGLDFYVSIYRNQVYIGNFHFTNITFVFPPGGVNLNGRII
ncbi:unnamed protein product [Fusarium graminearum]|nr:unnamed protein product [Fusarium graminearum]